jgi:hypothetical protein
MNLARRRFATHRKRTYVENRSSTVQNQHGTAILILSKPAATCRGLCARFWNLITTACSLIEMSAETLMKSRNS